MNDATAEEPVDVVETEEVDTETVEAAETEVSGDVDQQEAESPESSTEKKQVGVQKRIDELTRLRREVERDRDEVVEQRDYWKGKAEANPEPFMPGKSLSDFEYDEGKYSAYVLEEAQNQAKSETDQISQRNTQAKQQAAFKTKESDYSVSLDDYHTVTRNPELRLTEQMVSVVQDAAKGPEVLYYLGKNPEIAAELAAMPIHVMAMEIGRIEAQKLAKPKPTPTEAPAPAPKLKGADPKTVKEPSNMTDTEFAKWRQGQISKR